MVTSNQHCYKSSKHCFYINYSLTKKTNQMKSIIGIILILVGIVSLFRYPNFGQSIPESFGALIGLAIIIVPGILLIRSDNKNSNEK